MQSPCQPNTRGISEGASPTQGCLRGSAPSMNRQHRVRKKAGANASAFFSYPRSESNRDRQNRNLKFYPLNYRGIPVKGLQS